MREGHRFQGSYNNGLKAAAWWKLPLVPRNTPYSDRAGCLIVLHQSVVPDDGPLILYLTVGQVAPMREQHEPDGVVCALWQSRVQ
jgi:hypothetical protein